MKFIRNLFSLIGFFVVFLLGTSTNQYIKSDEIINNSNPDLLLWKKERKLKWSDFRGPIDNNSKYLAITSSQISIKSSSSEDHIILNISTYFKKHKSWSKKKEGHENLLKHEQLHFDIAELVARRMRKKISQLTYKNIKVIEGRIQTIYNDHINRVWNNYDVYDTETNHGINRDNQLLWEAKIKKELSLLNQFSLNTITIKKT